MIVYVVVPPNLKSQKIFNYNLHKDLFFETFKFFIGVV